MEFLFIYLLVVNAAGFLLMRADKIRAVKNRWRIRESTLIIASILGGSFGVILGMRIFRHKTRHAKFCIGLPVIMALQILLYVIYLAHTTM